MTVLGKARGLVSRARALAGHDVEGLRLQIEESKVLSAKVLIAQLASRGSVKQLHEAEFKVSSQFGDDGIIQYVIRAASAVADSFIEFGVESYQEANTRFLLVNDNWRGLVIDGSAENVAHIRRQPLYWRHDLTAVHAFVDRDNINELFRKNGFSGAIGILSIDIDGNDYWVWDAIDCVEPAIVIAEYNSVFGPSLAVTVPYDPAFVRTRAHHSNLFWGASLKALCMLAERKGYAFVGSNSHGNNAYFVKQGHLGALRAVSCEDGYRCSRFRESRDADGKLTFLGGDARLDAIRDMTVFDLESGANRRLADLLQRTS
jgi:hypothetical protein